MFVNQHVFLYLSFGPFMIVAPAFAANLCVNAGGSPGCTRTIAAAVTAAMPGDVINVGPGTYPEMVTVAKPLSFVGQGATIDASGLLRGFFVNGLATPGLSSVHISGFQVKNASLEGILVLNASNVTVDNNLVINNDLALSGGNCALPQAIEPGEAQDCGEGIHLQAVDHSVVSNNTVMNNSGGILLSDDTGATHDNVISNNNSNNNSYACGIVLASHVQAAQSTSLVPLGVYHNTVFGNRVQNNGFGINGGAGIGIFASVPGAQAYGNVIVDNLVVGNNHPGISIHSHAPNQNINDNIIVGNTVVSNGADTADAMTPGPTGINVYSATPATGMMITGNAISGESFDVAVKVPALVEVHYNQLGGLQSGVINLGAGTVDATENFWSCPNGPTIVGSCSLASGAGVSTMPAMQNPIPAQLNF